jgi:glucose/arabinose dehydrogenase
MKRIAPVLALLLLASCSSSSESARDADIPSSTTNTSSSVDTTSSTSAVSKSDVVVGQLTGAKLEVRDEFAITSPTATAVRPGDAGALYVTSQTGTVTRRGADGAVSVVMDIRDKTKREGERGLLGISFSLDGNTMYLNYTDREGVTVIQQFSALNDNTFDIVRAETLLTIEQPYDNHNGGSIKTLADGTLLIGTGDGGSAGDPEDRAQDPQSLLGKLLRIDPTPADPSEPFGIPADNPFVDNAAYRPEIWSIGLRNPWKIDVFDDTLYIADVGQDEYEEVNVISLQDARGANFGWALREANAKYKGDRPASNIDPTYVYSHDGGNCSISGGAIANDPTSPEPRGHYVFLDYCVGELIALDANSGFTRAVDLGLTVKRASGVERGPNGELVLLALQANTVQVLG